jgi:multiple antibiotic resistance protein
MTASAAFLLAFPALFAIVNPPGAALIFNQVTQGLDAADQAWLSRQVALYSLVVMLGALWGGAFVLNFFGISPGALRLAGGVVVALNAWNLLNAPERQEARKTEQAGAPVIRPEDVAFFPLTLPFTTGPGTIAVAITLGAERLGHGLALLWFFLGVSAAAVAVAGCVWVAYRSAGRVAGLMGETGRRTTARLVAFLLLCIGVQIMVDGAADVMRAIGAGGLSAPG